MLGVLTTWQGEWGPLGKWGLSPPFFLFCLFPLFSYTANRTPISQTPFSHPRHTHSHTTILFLCTPPLTLPTLLICSGIWRCQPCPTQRCQKWGLDFWTNDMGHAPCASPPPSPPDGFITSYAAHLKPIESLGGRECLTQISTSEGVSTTLGNC